MEDGAGAEMTEGRWARSEEKQRSKANTKNFHHFLNILLASPERLSQFEENYCRRDEIWVLFLCFQQHAISSRRLRDDEPIHYARSEVRTMNRIKGLEARSKESEARVQQMGGN